MKWSQLKWLERIWVYNAVPIALLAAIVLWATIRFYPQNPADPLGWAAALTGVASGAVIISMLFIMAERVWGRSGEWRARQAIMTRGLRSPKRGVSYTVLVYPEGGKIMMKTSCVRWKIRPWPLANPIAFNPAEGSARHLESNDHLAIYQAWVELSDQAARKNQELKEKNRRNFKDDRIALRINSQRRI